MKKRKINYVLGSEGIFHFIYYYEYFTAPFVVTSEARQWWRISVCLEQRTQTLKLLETHACRLVAIHKASLSPWQNWWAEGGQPGQPGQTLSALSLLSTQYRAASSGHQANVWGILVRKITHSVSVVRHIPFSTKLLAVVILLILKTTFGCKFYV